MPLEYRPRRDFAARTADRGGVTLVELLVVITLLLMITAITVPVIAPAIQQRRVREASRLTSSYFAAARSRAMETGRPVAVMIERFTPGLASASSSVSAAAAASSNLQAYSMNLSVAESQPPYAGDFSNSTVTISSPIGSGANTVQLTTFVSGDNWQSQQIHVGDRVRLNYQGPMYSITVAPVSSGSTLVTGLPWTLSPIAQLDVQLPAYMVPFPAAMSLSNFNVPFEIFRQPVRSAAAPLQLPEGIVIDMNYSGMGGTNTGVFIGTSSNQIISFTPTGGIDMVYDNGIERAVGPIFLLLGRREQVGGLSAMTNLADPNSLWITIGYQTGQVITSENYANNGGQLTSARSLATGSLSGMPVTSIGGN